MLTGLLIIVVSGIIFHMIERHYKYNVTFPMVTSAFVIFLSGLFFVLDDLNSSSCISGWSESGFEAKYEYGVCKINVDDKWIPARNYHVVNHKR